MALGIDMTLVEVEGWGMVTSWYNLRTEFKNVIMCATINVIPMFVCLDPVNRAIILPISISLT